MISVLFAGRKPVAARCLELLVARADVRIVGVLTDSHLEVSMTRDVAIAHDIPLFDYESATEALRTGRLKFDLGLSMLYWRRFRQEMIEHPGRGIVNFHPAPLPEYKGVGGYNLAILSGRDKWAVTAHYVDESIDTGPIISERSFPIDPERETARSLEFASQQQLIALFGDLIGPLIDNAGTVDTKPNGEGLYLSRRDLEAMKAIDLEKDDVARKVRAFWFPPYDGAYIEISGERYTLIDSSILSSLADPHASSLFTPPSRSS